MENKDLVISDALKQIEEKKKSFDGFKPEENYKFKTNCRFGEKNIKTLTINNLLECYVEAKQFCDTLKTVMETFAFIPAVYKNGGVAVRLHGFPAEDWLSDIEQLIKKEVYNDAVANLENSAYQLEQYYSKDKQDEIAINKILENIF